MQEKVEEKTKQRVDREKLILYKEIKKQFMNYRNKGSNKVRFYLMKIILDAYSVMKQSWMLGNINYIFNKRIRP